MPKMITLVHPTNASRTRQVEAGSLLERQLRRGAWHDPEAEPAPPAEPAGVDALSGKALTLALRTAGLTTTGTAAQKRARLAEHLVDRPAGASEDH